MAVTVHLSPELVVVPFGWNVRGMLLLTARSVLTVEMVLRLKVVAQLAVDRAEVYGSTAIEFRGQVICMPEVVMVQTHHMVMKILLVVVAAGVSPSTVVKTPPFRWTTEISLFQVDLWVILMFLLLRRMARMELSMWSCCPPSEQC